MACRLHFDLGWFRFRGLSRQVHCPACLLFQSPGLACSGLNHRQGDGGRPYRLHLPTSCVSRIPAGEAQWETLAGDWGAATVPSPSVSFRSVSTISCILFLGPAGPQCPPLMRFWPPPGDLCLWALAHLLPWSLPWWQLLAIASDRAPSLPAVSFLSSSITWATDAHIKFPLFDTPVFYFSFLEKSTVLVLFLKRKQSSSSSMFQNF